MFNNVFSFSFFAFCLINVTWIVFVSFNRFKNQPLHHFVFHEHFQILLKIYELTLILYKFWILETDIRKNRKNSFLIISNGKKTAFIGLKFNILFPVVNSYFRRFMSSLNQYKINSWDDKRFTLKKTTNYWYNDTFIHSAESWHAPWF